MAQSIEQARSEVQAAMATAVAWAESQERRSFEAFESRLWTLLLSVGRALVGLFLAHRAKRARAVEYCHGGKVYRLDDRRTSKLGTRFGKVDFERPVGRRAEDRSAAADLLWRSGRLDTLLALQPGHSNARILRSQPGDL